MRSSGTMYIAFIVTVFFMITHAAYLPADNTVGGDKDVKRCSGTANRFSTSGNARDRYEYYRLKYSNCTIVEGNLEITNLDMPGHQFDMTFLKDIEEVTGYVVIALNYVDVIPLDNLKVIKGETLLSIKTSHTDNALVVALNYWPTNDDQLEFGLRSLRLKSLKEISRGNVFLFDNKFMCEYPTLTAFWKAVMKAFGATYVSKDNCYHDDELNFNELSFDSIF